MTYLCTNPKLGALLPNYIASLLDDAQSEQVEAHLNDCLHCKGHYLTIVAARVEARQGVWARYEGQEDAGFIANIEDDDSSAGSSLEEATDVPPPLAQRKASNGS